VPCSARLRRGNTEKQSVLIGELPVAGGVPLARAIFDVHAFGNPWLQNSIALKMRGANWRTSKVIK